MYLPHLVPSVIGFQFPMTLSPLTSYVAPIISSNPPPLSQDSELEIWMNSRQEKSVVYLSMGSIFPLNKENAKSLVDGVMKTKYYLLWSLRKSNRDVLDGLKFDIQSFYI